MIIAFFGQILYFILIIIIIINSTSGVLIYQLWKVS